VVDGSQVVARPGDDGGIALDVFQAATAEAVAA
jgi:hypothetical protein